MSKKPPCYQDPDIFEEDHPDCLDCDFYGACKVLSQRALRNRKAKTKTKSRTSRGSSRKTRKEIAHRREADELSALWDSAPTVDVPGMGFVDKLLWNTIRQTGSAVFGELHRSWDESVPRVKYTSILKHLEKPSKEIINDSAEENSESEDDE